MNGPSDADDYWVDRVRRGDRTALEFLFRRYAGRVFGFAHALLRNREDAEEIVSEAFLRVFRSAAEMRGDGSFESWLLRIARNLCLDRLRRPRLLTLPLDEPSEMPLLLAYQVHSDQIDRTALRHLVETALDRLHDDYRVSLILRDVQGLSAREAAGVLGKTETAFRSLHQRARRQLRDALRELDRDDPASHEDDEQ